MNQNYPQDISYNEFILQMKEKVQELMGKPYTVDLVQMNKNNGVIYDSLKVTTKTQEISPMLHLREHYEAFLCGKSIGDVSSEIVHQYKEALIKYQLWSNEHKYSISKMKDSIVYRLINRQQNQILLEHMPHIPYLDLAIIYCCVMDTNDHHMTTIRITYDVMEYIGITKDELHQIASRNTARLFPPTFEPMHVMIHKLMLSPQERERYLTAECEWNEEFHEDEFTIKTGKKALYGEKRTLKNEDLKNTYEEDIKNVNVDTEYQDTTYPEDIYILSNNKGINGATAILYPNLLKQISRKMNSDLYILPSSIHEVIVLSVQKGYGKEELELMVKEINHSEVDIEDILSEKVYIYSKEKDCIHM